MRKQSPKEENMTSEVEPAPSYKDLFDKIDSLQGKDRQAFTRNLTMEEKRAYIRHFSQKEMQPIKGIFTGRECPGIALEFFGRAFDFEDATKYTLVEGCEYTLPRYL